MKDTYCPYCGELQDINHDDGYGYGEDEIFNQECSNCGKIFTFTTSVLFIYDTAKASCLNGGKHKFELTHTYPKKYSKMRCEMCGEERQPTTEERIKYKLDEEVQNA
ncbi:MAG: hypothetical protein PHE32_04110 [Candidatus Shapirobacteria bacterium]|nr:hypothetical protein [Candidatus Shapirobacteria bacterium]